ncbi:FAD-linked oxidase C-terminal domain-containing protein [Polycladidibacter hongkongensis]|uniref:FAD-linked oxidase C-terminal domain-containing protein n=1 Tax=Polycladidibacter hongkongensis TaxID=1647556 RepID=UPI00082AA010|nr:FAD-linked oxidase C-terminal domain-containing protein [Pseudovibrio hongkongensis]
MSAIRMPEPDAQVLARRAEIIAALEKILPKESVVSTPTQLRPYETDALTAYRQTPIAVVLPETTEQVAQILRYCSANKVKVVPRGAGTSLSGGALPLEDGILMSMMKFNRILDVDLPNRAVVTQPGVTNLGITREVEHAGFYFAPDPSSQLACSVGGNIAENSGGVHSLKYGLTTNNVLGLEMVLMNGDIIRLGGKHLDSEAYDLLALLTGSEGLLAVITEVTVRVLQKPEGQQAVLVGFPTIIAAGQCVADIIAAGIIPGGMELMDNLSIVAAENYVNAGYPTEAAALMIIELDGPQAEITDLLAQVEAITQKNGAIYQRISQSEEERALFWAGRKSAFPAFGRLAPDFLCMDGTIPRAKLPEVLLEMEALEQKHGLRCGNVFHAGDGNLHPLILYDANKPGDLEAAEAFGADILRLCVKVGGVLTGEHGVGIEKRDLMPEMFSETDLAHQERIKCAFDPHHLLNPGKVFPQLHRCAELGKMHISGGKLPFPDIPRF